jgi:hypothetical protein
MEWCALHFRLHNDKDGGDAMAWGTGGGVGLPSAGDDGGRGIHLIWPTEADVKGSFAGWSSGGSLPGTQKNVGKTFLQPLFCKWEAEHCLHQRLMPHIKSYCRCASAAPVVVPAGECRQSHSAYPNVPQAGSRPSAVHTQQRWPAVLALRHLARFIITRQSGQRPALTGFCMLLLQHRAARHLCEHRPRRRCAGFEAQRSRGSSLRATT